MSSDRRSTDAKLPSEVDREVGARVRGLRLGREMSQERLASALGVTFQQVQKYEKGVNRISAGRLQQIATTLDVPLSDLYGDGSGEPTKPAGIARTRQDLRLLRAFARIDDPAARKHLLDLAERMAATVEHPAR